MVLLTVAGYISCFTVCLFFLLLYVFYNILDVSTTGKVVNNFE